jgi:hypothetical protein
MRERGTGNFPCLVRIRPGRCQLLIVAARPASTARSFAAFSSGDACFFTREFVGRALLVCCPAPFGGNGSLRLGIHGCESTRCFPADRSARSSSFTSYAVATAIDATACGAVARPAARDAIAVECSAGFASLVDKVASVVGLVCHFNLLPR